MARANLAIGLPVFNGEKYLPTAIRSLLSQDYEDFELIISDNASEDQTGEICRSFAKVDKRIRYHRNDVNIGASANFNLLFSLSSAPYFKWAAHDDVHLPGFLRRTMKEMEAAPKHVVLVSPRAEIIDEHGNSVPEIAVEEMHVTEPSPHQRVAHVLDRVHWATSQYGVYRREVLQKTRLIDAFFASDRVLLAEIAMLGEIWEIPEVLFQHRNHREKSTFVNRTPAEMVSWMRASKSMVVSTVFRKRLTLEYVKSILRMPLTRRERISCLNVWLSRELPRILRKLRNRASVGTRVRNILNRK